MASLKYFILLILIFSSKISVAQTWEEDYNAGKSFLEKKDYRFALQHLLKAKAKYNTDTINSKYSLILFDLGNTYSALEIYDSSLYYFQRNFDIIKSAFTEDDPEYPLLLNTIGDANYNLGDYSKALEIYKKVFMIIGKSYGSNSREYLIAANRLRTVYIKLNKYKDAETYSYKILRLIEKKSGKETYEYLENILILLEFYINTGNIKKAVPLCIEYMEIEKKISNVDDHHNISIIFKLAEYYIDKGDYAKIEPLYLGLLNTVVKTQGEKHSYYKTILLKLGTLYIKKENYLQAEHYLLRYSNEVKLLEGEDSHDYSASLNELGCLYIELDDYNRAENYFLSSKKIFEKQKEIYPGDYAQSLANLASVYMDTEEEKSISLLLEAIAIKKKIGDTLDAKYGSGIINNLAIAYENKGECKLSESYFLNALDVIKRADGENSPQYKKVMLNLGLLYVLHSVEKAEPFLLSALNGASGFGMHRLIVLYSALKNFYSNQKNYLLAKNYILKGVQTLCSLFSNYTEFMSANDLEQSFSKNEYFFIDFNNFLYGYSKQFTELCKQSYNNELQNKGFILRNTRWVQNAIMKSGDTALINALENFRSIKSRLSKYYSLPIYERPDNVKELEAIAEGLEKKLVQGSQAFRNLKEEFSITWEDVQNKLGADEAAIEYISFNYHNNSEWTDSIMYGALVLRPGYTEPHFVYLFEQKQLKALLQKQPHSPNSSYFNNLYEYNSIGSPLQQLIWQPLDSLLAGVKRVYIAPSGLLHTINFAALPVSNSMHLGQQYQLHIVGTTGNIVKMQEQYLNNNSISKAWLFGGIDYDKTSNIPAKTKLENNIDFSLVAKESTRGNNSSWPFLSSTLYESAGIDSLCKQNKIQTEFMSGSFASETAFKNISGEPSSYILHLATHGYFFPDAEKKLQDNLLIAVNNKQDVFRLADNPLLRSGLIFSGANKSWNNPNYYSDSTDDGILTAYEISNLDLNGAKLVVMSACETGLGEIKSSEGVFGLQRSFKLAGASNIIMSLWEVPDVQTKELMKLFYENCFNGMTISDALKEAQFTMSKKYPPYYWAAFKLLE